MFYFPNLNVVYVPIERTASRSTEQYLFAHDPDGYRLGTHRHSCDISELNGISPSKIYLTRRHPWTRLCSMYTSDISKGFGGIYWDDLNSYLDFYIANESNPFLENIEPYPNLFSPMSKLINDTDVHFYRSQNYYLSRLDGYSVTHLKYEDLPSITQESWSNPEIAFPNIGDDNVNDIEYSLELENKLKYLWGNDYYGY